MSITADAVQAARCASWWIFLYQFCRGLFKVQYADMSREAIEAAMRDRSENGYRGVMPPSAQISVVGALGRWLAGERGYLPALVSEPFFVQPKGRRNKNCGNYVFSLDEMDAEWFGSVFIAVGDEMGLRPHASGLNSVRRNTMVGVQKGAERAGFDPAMHAKKTSQHRGDGHSCREKVYEDSTASTDICAFIMGRTPQMIESLKSLAMTRVPELAKYRTPKNVAADDPLRVKLLENDVQLLAVKRALDLFDAAVAKATSAAQRSQARAKVVELTNELGLVTRRLQKRVLEQKRQQVYADGQRALANMPLDEFRARSKVEDWGNLGLEELLSKLAAKCSKPVRVQGSRGSCSGDVLVVRVMDGLGANATRAERMEQRRHLRARSLGSELHEAALDEVALASTVMPVVPVETLAGMAMVETETLEMAVETPVTAMVQVETPVTAMMQVETPVTAMMQVETPAAVQGAVQSVLVQPMLGIRAEKRQRENELLCRYEQMLGECVNARMELARASHVPLGTLDGMLARARKRRAGAGGGAME